jgi:hypothetical protein
MQNAERDPSGLNAKDAGAKLDAGKPPVYRGVIAYFPRAVAAVANVSAAGAAKYSWKGWAGVPDGVNRYGDAMARHALATGRGEVFDSEGFRHEAQIAWNALARLELILIEEEEAAAKLAETKRIDAIRAKFPVDTRVQTTTGAIGTVSEVTDQGKLRLKEQVGLFEPEAFTILDSFKPGERCVITNCSTGPFCECIGTEVEILKVMPFGLYLVKQLETGTVGTKPGDWMDRVQPQEVTIDIMLLPERH